MKVVFLFTQALFREAFRPHARILAMGLSYLTLFSIVPVIGLIALAIATYDPSVTERFLMLLFTPLGVMAQYIVENLLGFVEKISLKNIGYIGIGVAVTSWFSMLRMIETATNELWHLHPRSFRFRNLFFYGLFVVISPIAITLATVVITLKASQDLNFWLMNFFNLSTSLNFLGYSMALVCLATVFSMIYFIAPNCRVRIKHAIVAGILAAISWVIIGTLFTRLISVFSNFSLIYSSFSTIVIFALWLFVSWMIVLAGVQLTFLLHHPVFIKMDPDDFALSLKEQKGLMENILNTVSTYYDENKKGLRKKELAREIPIPWREINLALLRLEKVGLIRRYSDRFFPTEEKSMEFSYEEISLLPEDSHLDVSRFLEKLR